MTSPTAGSQRLARANARPDSTAAHAAGSVPGGAIDTTVPHSARIWNYWLGGKDHYPVDREVGDQYRALYPGIVDTARAVRSFLVRTVRYLTAEEGVRQFLDIGTGLPAADNTHEIAQQAAPESRIVYVDNDPLVLTHARALLTSDPAGVCDYVDADLQHPDQIMTAVARTLDLSRPVAVLLLGVLGHVSDDTQAPAIVRDLMDRAAPGSYLILADSIDTGDAHVAAAEHYAAAGAIPYRLRSPGQIASFFDGLELLEPGLVSVERWRPDPAAVPPVHVDTLGGVARKKPPGA
jgi:S-adenosyl methyltransferase